MSQPQPVRGTHDLLPDDFRRHAHVVGVSRHVAARFGYAEMATPIFEVTEVFARTMGETSDVVSKEMYSFTDKGGEAITLRPEYTAGICRAFISNGLMQNVPVKVFAHGPMFRYERPQKGRQRQFHQIDIEAIGAAEPACDVEIIAVGHEILRELGLIDKATLELNSLGDPESRAHYRQVLVDYFTGHKDKLSKDSLERLGRNPLRILDSKDEGDRKIVANAPLLEESFNQAARDFFADVRRGLDALGIAYHVNPRLVRGLDYYTHTAFEFTTTHLGAQGALIAGGRYDGLIEQLGGPPTPGIGWAGGIERLAMLAGDVAVAVRPVALVPIGEAAEQAAPVMALKLRRAGLVVELAYKGKVGQRMKRADRAGASHAILVGDDELKAGEVTLRDLKDGSQEKLSLDAALAKLKARG
ncbi:histidine--tRNA ligase [Desertibaculum subflavum]|uniref:histidine--tRNA ligase n=1 Tax=Desertibaculum subflavum TaxID=2268458 RepID=UPI000E664CE5